jgi:hypothetical protein
MRLGARRAGGWLALLAGCGALGVAAFLARPGQLPADAGAVPVSAPTFAGAPPPSFSNGPPSSSASAPRPPSPSSASPPIVGWTPQQLVIDRLGVRAPVDAVGVRRGALDVPDDPAQVGWWVGSAVPGDGRGTVLLAGHVDTARAGKGAMFQLERLPMGATVDIRAGDRTFAYRAVARRSYPKQRAAGRLVRPPRPGPARPGHVWRCLPRRGVRPQRRGLRVTGRRQVTRFTGATWVSGSTKEELMTAASSPQGLPLAAAVGAEAVDDENKTPDSGPTVGRSDAEADAARSGADVDLSDATRDDDGVPVGEADADEDARQSGAS